MLFLANSLIRGEHISFVIENKMMAKLSGLGVMYRNEEYR